jgi:hypothetical protein
VFRPVVEVPPYRAALGTLPACGMAVFARGGCSRTAEGTAGAPGPVEGSSEPPGALNGVHAGRSATRSAAISNSADRGHTNRARTSNYANRGWTAVGAASDIRRSADSHFAFRRCGVRLRLQGRQSNGREVRFSAGHRRSLEVPAATHFCTEDANTAEKVQGRRCIRLTRCGPIAVAPSTLTCLTEAGRRRHCRSGETLAPPRHPHHFFEPFNARDCAWYIAIHGLDALASFG